MAQKTHKYSNGEVSIIWKPDICQHSAICFNGLTEVFNPNIRPWINPLGAKTERIIEQVKKCPSGALSYFINAEESGSVEEIKEVVSEIATVAKIEVSPNGPYIIRSECIIKLPDGTEEMKKSVVCLCRCGSSQNKPYCDGSHKRVGFAG